MIIKNNLVRDSVKHHEVSNEFSHLLAEGAEIKESQVFIVVVMSVIVIQKLKRISNQEQESVNQFKGIQIQLLMMSNILLLLRVDESVEIMGQIMLQCVSVIELIVWRRRQDEGRNQENHEEINPRQSHLYLRISRVMSYVFFYSFFCGFVIFNSLHASNQSSVQKSSAQPCH